MEFSDLPTVERDGLARVTAAGSLEDLHGAQTDILGRQSSIAELQRALGSVPPEGRKEAGRQLNAVRSALENAVSLRQAELELREYEARLEAERMDLTEVTTHARRGHLHLVTQTQEHLEDVFVGMGFTIAEGPEVESDFYNFEALNMPKAHPARSSQDTLYFDYGEPESTLIRTQTSPVQIRVMQMQKPPIYVVCPGRVYRKETPDPRHVPTFHQIEGLVVDRGITFGDLAGTIQAFTEAYFGAGITSRLRPGSFAYTEPSAEFEVTCPICSGAGCRTCSHTGWIELGGSGMVHPRVLETCGIDSEEWSGFAFGFGIDRLAQVRHTISDMRLMFQNDIRFVHQF